MWTTLTVICIFNHTLTPNRTLNNQACSTIVSSQVLDKGFSPFDDIQFVVVVVVVVIEKPLTCFLLIFW